MPMVNGYLHGFLGQCISTEFSPSQLLEMPPSARTSGLRGISSPACPRSIPRPRELTPCSISRAVGRFVKIAYLIFVLPSPFFSNERAEIRKRENYGKIDLETI